MDEKEEKIQQTIQEIRYSLEHGWEDVNTRLTKKRLEWFEKNHENLNLTGSDVRKAYTLFLLEYLKIDPTQVPVVYEDDRRIVWRSMNWCPVAEACQREGHDSRMVCRMGWERSVEEMIQKINPKLRFTRNYEKIRPYSEFCEEIIELE